MPFTLFMLNGEIDISSAVNILILCVLLKMIGNTKCPFSLVLLVCVCVLLRLDRLSGFVETVQACLIEVARSGWIERPLLIR